MDELLKNYLESLEEFRNITDIEIISHNYNAHMCKVNFTYKNNYGSHSESKHLDVWSVMSFVYKNIKK